jgi:hypothetical protein
LRIHSTRDYHPEATGEISHKQLLQKEIKNSPLSVNDADWQTISGERQPERAKIYDGGLND